jgi:serine/threonine-protein kinase
MTHPEGLQIGNWRIGPRTRTFLLRPPAGKVITHEGEDVRTGERVGVLLVREPWGRNPLIRQDYLHGARLVSRLDHPHVVKVHDVIDEQDVFALVSEPLPGDNLHRHVKYGAVIPSEAEVVRIMSEVAAGLGHAHGRGVVFGNVKPTNVELLPDGTAKLLALPKRPFTFTSFLDAAAYLGYPAYCPPELLRGEPLSERSDIYGLGITAYELIVARLPCEPTGNLATDLGELAGKEWPAPAEVVGEINPLLNRVVTRCLHKDPAQRYESVAELRRDLDRVQASSSRLISQARLLETVTAVFPTPLAVLAQSLERDDHLLAQRDKLLNLANGLVSYLGFLAAQGRGRPLGREFSRPSLGHWVGLVRETLRAEERVWPLDELARGGADADLPRALADVVPLRNEMAHGAVPEEGVVLHDWVKRLAGCVRRLYRSLLVLAKYTLVAVEDLDYQGDQFVLGLRRLDGLGPPGPAFPVPSAQPRTKGRVYLAAADCSRMISLYPWVVFAKCPLCFQRELFFFTSMAGGQVHYVTPDRGHTWSCPAPEELEKAIGP